MLIKPHFKCWNFYELCLGSLFMSLVFNSWYALTLLPMPRCIWVRPCQLIPRLEPHFLGVVHGSLTAPKCPEPTLSSIKPKSLPFILYIQLHQPTYTLLCRSKKTYTLLNLKMTTFHCWLATCRISTCPTSVSIISNAWLKPFPLPHSQFFPNSPFSHSICYSLWLICTIFNYFMPI